VWWRGGMGRNNIPQTQGWIMVPPALRLESDCGPLPLVI